MKIFPSSELAFTAYVSPEERALYPTLPILRVTSRSRITQPGYRKGEDPPNKGRRYPATPPTPAEVIRILDLCDPSTKRGVRNRALIATLWRTGLRVSEGLALIPYQVDFDASTVTVLSGKGGKRRVVGIDSGALDEIALWLETRSRLPIRDPDTARLFCTVNLPSPGGPVHPAYVRELLREFRLRAGIPHRVAPHQLRHAHAVELARERTPMHLLQRQLGHSSLGTTATYLASVAPGEVIDIVSKREWQT